jgi:HSP20 family molecular chaperone IbpA
MRIGPNRANDVFSQLFREMDEMTKGMGFNADKDMEVIDISGMLEDMMKSMAGQNRRGFSLRINQKNDERPKIVFKRIGDDQKLHRTGKSIIPKLRRPAEGRQPAHRLSIKLPGDTSEPETDIKRAGNKVLVDIMLPGVRGSGDIDIIELENSVEIKAVAGSRGYFKIIRKPEFSRIQKKSFNNGTLKLEIL